MADAFTKRSKAVLLGMEHIDVAPDLFGRAYQGGMAAGGVDARRTSAACASGFGGSAAQIRPPPQS